MRSNNDAFEPTPMGRSLDELTTPRSPLVPQVEIFDGMLLEIENALRPTVPEEIRKRIAVTRNLAVYGAFCYDFFAVSVFWSYTCIEMALWAKFLELNPDRQHNKRKSTLGWLLKWASKQRLLPENLRHPDAIARLRNSFAHPKDFSFVVTPGMAADAFQLLVDIVNHLWPVELPS